MFKAFVKYILLLFGWKIRGGLPEGIKKCVVIMAPHTSNWDFVTGRLAFFTLGIRARILIKKEVFKPVIGSLFRGLGGIPVDRGKKTGIVDQVVDLFEQYDSLYVVITPEATRSLNTKWKMGFYRIAVKANVPIAFGYMDYKEKTGGIAKVIYPTGDVDADFALIEDFYKGKHAKYPEKFNLSNYYLQKNTESGQKD